MIGAIAGDIVGSVYEGRLRSIKRKDFELFGPRNQFTDDTVCTIAVAECLMNNGDFASYLRRWVRRHPRAGYGGMFYKWAVSETKGPYNSWGNGGAMRVSPVAHLARDEAEALTLAEQSAAVTHDHPEGIKGAQAVALAMFRAFAGTPVAEIRAEIAERFAYDLTRSVREIRPKYRFDVSAAGSVPQALTCAFEAMDYEDAVRNAISIGGDSDTIAAIAGGLAETLFSVPASISRAARGYLDEDMIPVLDRFERMADRE